MNFKNIADHFRHQTTLLAVKEVIIVSDTGDFTGTGKLQRSGDQIELEVVLDGDRELPMVGGTYTREQFWKIGGIIEGQVPFWGVSLPDQSAIRSGRFTILGGRFHFDRIYHLAAPFNGGGMREAILKAASGSQEASDTLVRGWAIARFANYKLVWQDLMTVTVEENDFLGKATRTERDTFLGAFGDFEYGLIQRGDDCELHLRLKEGVSASPGAMERVSQAFYRALAFAHGRHTWPQWEQISSGTGNVLEYVTAPRAFSENIHTLLTERTCAHGSKLALLIEKAVQCFLRGDEFSHALDDYLFLAREAAGKDTPAHVGTLGLCAVFEGFVGFLHEHFGSNQATLPATEFEQVRARLVQYAKESAGGEASDDAPWQRFIRIIQSARSMRPAEKFRQMVEHFRLPWEKMSPSLDAWKAHRHPLAHGAALRHDLMEQLVARSRIAGAINVLAAAAVGYSGTAVLSRIDDQFINLP